MMDANMKAQISNEIWECATEGKLRSVVMNHFPCVFFDSEFVGLSYGDAASKMRELGRGQDADLLDEAAWTLKVIHS